MLSYKEYDNAQAVEIVLKGRGSTEEFDALATRLEAFIGRHGHVRVLEIVQDFEGMDASAFWHDIKSACGTSRISAVSRSSPIPTRTTSGRAWWRPSWLARWSISLPAKRTAPATG
jgi:hypothetical protein